MATAIYVSIERVDVEYRHELAIAIEKHLDGLVTSTGGGTSFGLEAEESDMDFDTRTNDPHEIGATTAKIWAYLNERQLRVLRVSVVPDQSA
jgi:hypothetical protein